MNEKDRIFLTPQEAVAAIVTDFQQYRPQMRLFKEISVLLLRKETVWIPDWRDFRVWIFEGKGAKGKKIPPTKLREILCNALRDDPPRLSLLPEICSKVFETCAEPGKDAHGREGIWIETGMESYICRKCGKCCRTLDYHRELTEADYLRWQEERLQEIMDHVAVLPQKGESDGERRYEIWIDPATGKHFDGCPWLTRVEGTDQQICTIHAVRPGICRNYPGTRKHARMTGCIGFDK